MDLLDSLRVLRRRWLVVVAALLAGIVAGWISAPGDDAPTTFTATHTMIVNPSVGGINLEQAALLATTGAVPERVGEQVGLEPGEVDDQVDATADVALAVLTISGSSADPLEAEVLADLTADELVTELLGARGEIFEAEVARLDEQVAFARLRVAELQDAPGALDGTDTAAAAELQAARNDLTAALEALQSFASQGAPQPPLQTVEVAVARPTDADGIAAPSSKPARAALLGAFGLLLGIGAAFALDKLDTRIQTKRAAELAFGYPVVAEIPPLPRRTTDELLAVTRPASPFVEAHRGLRTILALDALEATSGEGRVILVTSPMAGEAKTTTVANLAVTLAEVGRSVLVVSADFRRPRLHAYFDRPREPGLTEALSTSPHAPGLADLQLDTDVEGVRFLPSGAPVDNPGPMLERAGDLIRAARGLFDFVLVDSPPLLVANDTLSLAQEVDGVLVLARSGRTTIDAAERSAEMLRRFEIPVLGVVVTAAGDTPTAYRYYRNNYYTETEAPRRRFSPFRQHPGDVATKHGNGGAASATAPTPVGADHGREG